MIEVEDVKRIHSEQSIWTAIKRELTTFAGTFSMFAGYWLTVGLLVMWRMGWL